MGRKNTEYKTMKVFTNTNMTEEVVKFLAEENKGTSNDVFLEWYVYGTGKKCIQEVPEDADIVYNDGTGVVFVRGDDPVSDWLHENGAEMFEEVLIEYSW